MPFKISFLKWKKPLSKEISKTGTKTFPNAKNLTSESHLISNIKELHKHMLAHANKGHCMLKGPLTEELKNESRAGKISPTTPTEFIVIDIDGLEMKCPSNLDKSKLEMIGDDILDLLPDFLRNSSYIIQASSSLGFKQDTVSLHLFFMLDIPMAPSTIKKWLTNINFTLNYFKERLELTKTGWDVKYTLDRCMADNSRIIYIAPPVIKGVTDPFKSKNDRIALITKKASTVSSALIQEGALESTSAIKNEVVRELRKAEGLDTRQKAKFSSVRIDGRDVQVLANPAACVLEPSYVDRGWCYYNMNGGDSNAYYHPEGKPDYIYNFKDEAVFRWKDVDPAGFEHYCNVHGDLIKKKNPVNKFAVISKQDDVLYKIEHNHKTDELRVSPSDLTKAAHFYRDNGMVMPETINEWDIEFNPSNMSKVDYDGKRINTYEPSEYIRRAQQPKQDCTYEYLQNLCPSTFKVLRHVFGNGDEELRHWLNWFSFVVQAKRKSNTCWFLWGVQGTGKGVLFNHILRPLFGKQNCSLHLNTSLEDTFDAWRADKQLVVIDEFELPKGKKGDRIMERIKNWTAEGDNSIRDMRKIVATKEGIEAYMFFSNKYDMVMVDDHDRRFNIAPRQETPLKDMPWWEGSKTIEEVDHELQLFTNFITHYDYDEVQARTALLNEAKIQAANATKTAAETFCSAIKSKDLNPFIDLLYVDAHELGISAADDEHFVLQTAKSEVKRWVSEVLNNPMIPVTISPHQMANVYRALSGQTLSAPSTSKMMARHGVTTTHTSFNGRKGRFFKLEFNTPTLSKKEIKILLTDAIASVTSIKGKTA